MRVSYPAWHMSIIKASYGFDGCVQMCMVHTLIQGFGLIILQKSIEFCLFFFEVPRLLKAYCFYSILLELQSKLLIFGGIDFIIWLSGS